MLLGFCLGNFGILFCSVVFGCRRHLKLLDRVVSGACFLAGGVLNCDLSHRRSVAVLCMLYKIRCNPAEAQSFWISTCALCGSPGYMRCFDRTSVYFCVSPLQNLAVPQEFYSPLSISLEWSGWPRIWWCWIGGFQEQVQCLLFSLSLPFLYRLVVWGWSLLTDRVSISLSRPCIANLF